MMPAQAISMLADCADATGNLTIAVNCSRRGTQSLAKEERKAYTAVFLALVGRKPTSEELETITR